MDYPYKDHNGKLSIRTMLLAFTIVDKQAHTARNIGNNSQPVLRFASSNSFSVECLNSICASSGGTFIVTIDLLWSLISIGSACIFFSPFFSWICSRLSACSRTDNSCHYCHNSYIAALRNRLCVVYRTVKPCLPDAVGSGYLRLTKTVKRCCSHFF